MNKKVSIIIPVYRAADTVERCVRTLCEGTYKNIEILLIEDWSPDDSWSVCLDLQDKYVQVKAFRNEKNLGVSATRNRGLQEMTGHYLMFVDSDDWTEPDFVESFVNAHTMYGADMTVCGYMNHDEVQNYRTDYFGWEETDEIIERPLKESLIALLKGRLLQQIWNKFFLVSVIKTNAVCFDESIKFGEDFRFVLSYLRHCQGDKLVTINRPLYHYIRCSTTSAMSNFGTEGIDESLKNLRMMYEVMGKSDEEIEAKLIKDREDQLRSYAYMIMHNMGMKLAQKKEHIYALDKLLGKQLYKENKKLYVKERFIIFAKRIGLKK